MFNETRRNGWDVETGVDLVPQAKRRSPSTLKALCGVTPRQRATGRMFGWWALSLVLSFVTGWFVQAAEMAHLVSQMCGAG